MFFLNFVYLFSRHTAQKLQKGSEIVERIQKSAKRLILNMKVSADLFEYLSRINKLTQFFKTNFFLKKGLRQKNMHRKKIHFSASIRMGALKLC